MYNQNHPKVKEESMKRGKIVIIFPAIIVSLLLITPSLSAQGYFEFGFHYSQWSLDLLRGAIEEGIGDALETDLKDEILEEIREDHPSIREKSYDQSVSFDSGGSNYGFEVRWYPGGQFGSFSIGLSVEKTEMRVSLPDVSVNMLLEEQNTLREASFSGSVQTAQFIIKPTSFHLHFRWDIKPSARVHPYITFGAGLATGSVLEKATYEVQWSGQLQRLGEAPENYSGTESKTLKQLKDEREAEGEDFFLPSVLPIIQLNFGIKGEITENLFLLIDAGIWNGFIIRGGVAFRI